MLDLALSERFEGLELGHGGQCFDGGSAFGLGFLWLGEEPLEEVVDSD